MNRKKAAVGQVHAIQERSGVPCMASPRELDAPEREALGDVVAHEIDDDGAGNERQRAGRRKKASS